MSGWEDPALTLPISPPVLQRSFAVISKALVNLLPGCATRRGELDSLPLSLSSAWPEVFHFQRESPISSSSYLSTKLIFKDSPGSWGPAPQTQNPMAPVFALFVKQGLSSSLGSVADILIGPLVNLILCQPVSMEGSKWHPAGPTHSLITISDNPRSKLPLFQASSLLPLWLLENSFTCHQPLHLPFALVPPEYFNQSVSDTNTGKFNEKTVPSLQVGLLIIPTEIWGLCVVLVLPWCILNTWWKFSPISQRHLQSLFAYCVFSGWFPSCHLRYMNFHLEAFPLLSLLTRGAPWFHPRVSLEWSLSNHDKLCILSVGGGWITLGRGSPKLISLLTLRWPEQDLLGWAAGAFVASGGEDHPHCIQLSLGGK